VEFVAWLRTKTRLLARIGCISIGSVYILIGVLALLALSGRMIEMADEDRIIYLLMRLPGGAIVVWAIIAGAAGYVLWRATEVIADPYEFGSGWKGKLQRAGVGLSALGYGIIACSAARIALRYNGGVRDAAEQEQQLVVAQALLWPAGNLLVGAAGVILITVGIVQFALVIRRSYAIEIDIKPRSARAERILHGLAWYGYAARGVILCVLGYFLVNAAVTHDAAAAGDTDTAFDFIGGGVVGDSAFFVVALGTVAYGIFMYCCAVYYRFGSVSGSVEAMD
jgi:Domain of Unknown Function (DUF1206)